MDNPMMEKPQNGFRFSLTAVIVILFVVLTALALAIAYAELAEGQELQEPETKEARLEMFGWKAEDNELVWTFSSGRSDEQGNYVMTGKPKTYIWRIREGTIVSEKGAYKLSVSMQEHLEAMMLHVAYDLYRLSNPGDDSEEPTPARAGGIECL